MRFSHGVPASLGADYTAFGEMLCMSARSMDDIAPEYHRLVAPMRFVGA
jgi:hypothetical protein